MLICLVPGTQVVINQLYVEGFHQILTENVALQPVSADKENTRIKEYCQKLSGALGSNGTLSFHLDWAPSHPENVWLRLHGKLLERLHQLCGKEIKLSVNGHFKCPVDSTRFKTAEMEVFIPSTLADASSALDEQEACCEDTDVEMSNNAFRNISSPLQNVPLGISVKLLVADEYLRQAETDPGALRVICKTIQENTVHSDISIVATSADGKDTVILAYKCFLSVHSPVLKAILEGEFKETETNQIKIDYSEECVRSLLDYMYTLDFSEAVNCSELAVELFQAANYYQIKPLEDKLVEIFLLRGNSWFDVNSAIELFEFAGKIDTSSSMELKIKTVEVLKSKPSDQILKSAKFEEIFATKSATGMELCAMALAK